MTILPFNFFIGHMYIYKYLYTQNKKGTGFLYGKKSIIKLIDVKTFSSSCLFSVLKFELEGIRRKF